MARIEKLVANVLPKGVRNDTLEGKSYVVVPMIILTEGVHNGSQGPLYYPKEELQKTPAVWNHKPIVVYHPELNGQGISACDPTVINNRKVGIMLNTRFEDGKLKSEAWIDREKADNVDSRIMQAVDNGEMMELSTGVFTDAEPEEGTWNSEEYTAIARNYRPDHLALLPDKVGACSIADGAGFLRNQRQGEQKKGLMSLFQSAMRKMGLATNELSHDTIRERLSLALRERFLGQQDQDDRFLFVEDVFPNFVIFELDFRFWRLPYTATDTDVTLGDEEPVEVMRVTEWRTSDGQVIGNKQENQTTTTMNREETIQAIITANVGWSEQDKEGLEAMSDDQLGKVHNLATNQGTTQNKGEDPNQGKRETTQSAASGGTPSEPAPASTAAAAPARNSEKSQSDMTAEEYIQQAPSQLQDVLHNSLQVYNQEKSRLVERVFNNKRNGYSKEALQSKSIDELRNLAALAGDEEDQSGGRAYNFGGQAPVPAANANEEEPLDVPALNFAKE